MAGPGTSSSYRWWCCYAAYHWLCIVTATHRGPPCTAQHWVVRGCVVVAVELVACYGVLLLPLATSCALTS